MQFPYAGCIVNLLDTPGHADFSEDTYRVLTAVDSALMVIDCAKGVEARTIKLIVQKRFYRTIRAYFPANAGKSVLDTFLS